MRRQDLAPGISQDKGDELRGKVWIRRVQQRRDGVRRQLIAPRVDLDDLQLVRHIAQRVGHIDDAGVRLAQRQPRDNLPDIALFGCQIAQRAR